MNSESVAPVEQRRGAYGLHLAGFDAATAAALLQPAPATAPTWTIEQRVASAADRISDEVLTDDNAELLLTVGGWIEADRSERRFVIHTPADQTSAGALIHPFMAKGCMVAAHWRGGLALHAGAVVIDGRAWGVIGPKGAGKSTTMALLDRAGFPVLADDLLIIENGEVLAGPRLIDLRSSAAEQFPSAVNVGRMGLRVRWRLPLAPAPWSAPLAGFLLLSWADESSATLVPAVERLAIISEALNVYRPPADPRVFLDLAAMPMVMLARPRSFEATDELEALIRQVASEWAPA